MYLHLAKYIQENPFETTNFQYIKVGLKEIQNFTLFHFLCFFNFFLRLQVQDIIEIFVIGEPTIKHPGWVCTDQWQTESKHTPSSGPDCQPSQEEASAEDYRHITDQHDCHDAYRVCHLPVPLQNLIKGGPSYPA